MRIPAALFLLFAVLAFLIPISAIRHYTPNTAVETHSPSLPATMPVPAPANPEQLPAYETEPAVLPQYPQTEDDFTEYERNIPEVTHFLILNESTGKVEKVSVKDYVRGALASELPATFHLEAMKAQAVSAHTYALYQHMFQQQSPDPALKGADFSADPQNRHGYATEETMRAFYGDMADVYWNKVCQAADTTLGYVMTYQGEPILAAYHSASSGQTEDAANVWMTYVPYLMPVESEGDLLSPALESTVTFSPQELQTALEASFADIHLPDDKTAWFTIIDRSDSGYITLIDAGNLTLHGRDIRTALGLRSTNFTIKYQSGVFTFDVKGYGHGVGLSQYGADYLARQGYTFDEILQHYYPGATLDSID